MIRKRLLVLVVTMVVIALGVTAIPMARADGPIPSDPQRPGPPSARGIQPVEYDGNPDCIDFAPEGEVWKQLKVDPVEDGQYSDEYLVVTVHQRSTEEGPVFDWTSNANLEAIFVKGGPRGNFYDYSGVDYVWDDDLHASINPNNDKYFGLSHTSFCYIEVSPTPTPSPTPTEVPPSPTPTGTPAPAPSPTPTEVPPSPTPTEVPPSPTPPGETPSPTPVQETPSPTPPDDTPTPVPDPEMTPTPAVETPTPEPAPDATPTPQPEVTPTPEPVVLPVTGGGSGLALWLALVGAGSILFLISPAIRRRLTTAT